MGALSITVVDLVAGFVILVSAGLAAWRGLMRETLSILSWIVAAYLAYLFYPTFRPMVRGFISPAWLADTVDFAALFIILLVPLSFMSFRMAEGVKKSEIGPVDRALGFVFGIGRGLVVIGLAYIVFGYLVPPAKDPDWLKGARVYPVVQKTSVLLKSIVPRVGIGAPTDGESSGTATDNAGGSDTKTYGAAERRTLDRLIQATGPAKDSSR
jgi:membrane protein required for colicin V production